MTKTEQQYKRMTETPIPRLITLLAIPTMISMLITNIYNVVDTAFVGTLGTSASGAVGVVFGFMAIIQAFGFLFGQGGGSIISRMLGDRQPERASETASTAFFCSLFMGFVITVFGFFTLDSLVRWLGSTETIAPFAKTYIAYILFAAPFMTTSFTMNSILRYEGKASLGMIGLLVGSILNIGGDYFFMMILNMGIAGAGLSTCIGQIISWGILLSMFLKGRTTSRISFRHLSSEKLMICVNTVLLREIVLTGIPSLLRQILNSVTTILLNVLSSAYGDEVVAAMSIVNRIVFFVFSMALGVGQGFQPVCSFNYGARKFDRVRKAIWFTAALGMIFILVAIAATLQFPDEIIRIFRDDPAVIKVAHRALVLQMLLLPTLPLSVVTEMTYQCTGKKGGAALLSSLRSGFIFMPALYILAHTRGVAGIQEAQPVAYGLSFFISLLFFVMYMKKLPRETEEKTE
ncbi:MATE family efflux transporter [Oribacterium sp. P6A1]|uniref:MATE family efflux transporter n=1 Tax=Oribacterium sp. P6A1 TaxID=1410612 RepID=UPI00055F7A86|nr:MATE family efflux transporter [Oribacterium sp. P6A1]